VGEDADALAGELGDVVAFGGERAEEEQFGSEVPAGCPCAVGLVRPAAAATAEDDAPPGCSDTIFRMRLTRETTCAPRIASATSHRPIVHMVSLRRSQDHVMSESGIGLAATFDSTGRL
jgi:hypothetical protein